MTVDHDDPAPQSMDLSAVVRGLEAELRCLLGPAIRLCTGALPAGGMAPVRAGHAEVVNLLRHLALDARDAMPAGGTMTIRTGVLGELPECAAVVIHEVPALASADIVAGDEHIRKGRSLGLGASHETIERAGGHLHLSCRHGETVLTICFPLAN